mgnify:FL=1
MGEFLFETLLVGLLTAILLLVMLVLKFIFDLPLSDQWTTSSLYRELINARTERHLLIEQMTRQMKEIKAITKQLYDLQQSSVNEKQENEFKRRRVDALYKDVTKDVHDR